MNKKTNTKKDDVFDFLEAIRRILNGGLISRRRWNNKERYGLIKDGFLQIHNPNGTYYFWTISINDIVGTDWIEV